MRQDTRRCRNNRGIDWRASIKRLLFVCVENAGRSQMAEAFANHHGKGKIVASSAGVKLAERVNPLVVEVMKEKGIDISRSKSKLLTVEMTKEADQVITMGCSVEQFCPAPLVKNVVDWDLEDPEEKPVQKVRDIRDVIEQKVLTLLTEIKPTD